MGAAQEMLRFSSSDKRKATEMLLTYGKHIILRQMICLCFLISIIMAVDECWLALYR